MQGLFNYLRTSAFALSKTGIHRNLLNIYLLFKRIPLDNVLRMNSTGNKKETGRPVQPLKVAQVGGGCCDVQWIYSGYILKKIQQGLLMDCVWSMEYGKESSMISKFWPEQLERKCCGNQNERL